MKRCYGVLAIILSIVMFLSSGIEGICAEVQEVAVGTETENLQQEIVINPLYEGYVDEEAIREELALFSSGSVQSGEVSGDAPTYKSTIVEFTTYESLVAYVRNQLLARNNTFTFKYNSTVQPDAKQLVDDAMAHIEGGSGQLGDALSFAYKGFECSMSYNGTEKTFAYTVTYYTTAEQERQLTEAVNSALTSMNLSKLSDPEKIRKIHDYICKNVSYDYAHLSDEDYYLQYTAYAALINKTAVCQGYAVLFYRMCMDAGIDVRIIPGLTYNEPHAWNIVEINDKYYNVDTTWDDQESNISYSYYLKSNADFFGHTRRLDYNTSEFNTAYPMAPTSYNEAFAYKWTTLNSGSVAVGNASKLYYAVNKPATIGISVYYGNNAYLKTIVSNKSVATNDQVAVWDLKDANGNYVDNGTYRYTITAIDGEGNKIVSHKYFTVTGKEPFAYKWTTLNSGSVAVGNASKLYYAVNRPATIGISVYYGNNAYLKTIVSNKSVATNDQVAVWDLKDANGNYVENGTYRYTITAVDEEGNKIVSHKYFTVTGNEPFAYKWTTLNSGSVAVGNASKLYYAVNRPATIGISVYYGNNAYLKTIVSNKSVGTNDQVAVWDLKDAKGNYVANGTYRYTITAIDAKGNKIVSHKYFTVTRK